MPPRVSLLLSVRNGNPFLQETAQAWLAQTFGDFELLVWDNGSSDGSLDTIRRARDPRIRIVYSGPDRDLQAGLFGLLDEAVGEFCLSPDADDVPHPALLESLVKRMDAADRPLLAHAGFRLIDGDGVPCGQGFQPQVALPDSLPGADMLRVLLQHNPVKKSTALLSTKTAKMAAERANHRMFSAVDWYFWFLVVSHRGEVAFLDDPLLDYRLHPGSLSHFGSWKGLRAVEDLLAPWCGLEDAARHSQNAKNIRQSLKGMLEPVLLARMLLVFLTSGHVHPEFPHSAPRILSRSFFSPLRALQTHARLRREIPFPCSGFLAADEKIFRQSGR